MKSTDDVPVREEQHSPEEQDDRFLPDVISGAVSPRYRRWLRWSYRFKKLSGPKKDSEGPPV